VSTAIIPAVVSGLIGGVVTGAMLLAGLRVHVRWLHAEIQNLHHRITQHERAYHGA